MKKFITIIFTIICTNSFSQEKKLVWTMITCENGTEKAEKDFKQGYYFCEHFGLVASNNSGFSEFYENYIKTKYGIISVNGGCVMNDYRKCYSEKMTSLISEKFGEDIFEKSLKEAQELYSKNKY